MEKLQHLMEQLKQPRARKIMSIGLVVALVLWVVFRFTMIGIENARSVYNASRVAQTDGVPVVVQQIERTSGVLREPIAVKSNRAYVASGRAHKFGAGQHVAGGVIVSVSPDIDLDSGMHVVRTRGVADGLQYAEFRATGHFVPVYAVNNGVVMVVDGDIARARDVVVARQDAENALISSGLNDGDVVILTHVSDGEKIQVKE
ncbi:MAG TPA: hypothetical protein DD611_02950 [Alphaproteobacteria bacterium]|nr:hypothetical protein [Alphaproteobacteria bacterium]